MKKLYSLALCAGILSNAMAQKVIVEEVKETFPQGNITAYKLYVPHAAFKDVDNAWKNWLKENNGKFSKVKNTYFSDNTVVKQLGSGTVDIYTNIINKKENGTELTSAFDFDGKYISCADMADKCSVVKAMLTKFAFELSNNKLADNLKNETKKMEKLTDKLKDLEKDNTDLKADIEKAKLKTEKNNNNLQFSEQGLTKKSDEVVIQKRVVDASAGAVNEQAESSKKIYEKLKKEQLNLEKEIKNFKNDNVDLKEKINKLEGKVKENENEQSDTKKSIESQSVAIEKIKKMVEQLKM